MKMQHSGARLGRARLITLTALASVALVVGGIQPATALIPAAPDDNLSAPQVIEVVNAALADEPQLALTGTVNVMAVDLTGSSHTEYSVTTHTGSVRISGDLDAITGGSTFTGTVALPASLTDRALGRLSSRIEDSALSPIRSNEVDGIQLLKLAESEAQPLEVVSASIQLAEASLNTAAHILDIAVINGAPFSDAEVDKNVAGLSAFWSSQSDGVISSVTRPTAIQRYTSTYLATCNFEAMWNEAAKKFLGASASGYQYALETGRHLIVIADQVDSQPNCGLGVGSKGGGTNGSGRVWVNTHSEIDLHALAHEFGHNLGLGHANVHECADQARVEGTLAQGCEDFEYQDIYDVMGLGYTYRGVGTTNQLAALNVTDRVSLGFLPAGFLSTVNTPTASVTLAPVSARAGLRAVQVQDPRSGDTYYVEYRSGTGMDAGAFYTKTFPSGSAAKVLSLRPGVRILKLRSGATSLAVALLKQPGDPVKMLAMKAGDRFTTQSGGLVVNFTGVSAGSAVLSIARHSATPPGTAGPAMERISGANRFETAVAVSKKAYPGGAPVVYVAQAADYPDALAAAPAAVAEGGPLLLTDGNTLTPIVKSEIQRLKPAKIVVVGGTGVIRPAVFSALTALAPANTVRVGGIDRYETGRLVVKQAFLDRAGASGAPLAYIATGAGFPDALSASAAAGSEGAPVILINGSQGFVDAATVSLLKALGVTQTRVAGGNAVVSVGAQRSLATMSAVTRSAGINRFDTNHLVNSAIFSNAADVYLATGYQFPDALAGAALAGARGAPLYLVETTCIPAQTLKDIVDGGAATATLIGGAGVLTDSVRRLARC